MKRLIGALLILTVFSFHAEARFTEVADGSGAVAQNFVRPAGGDAEESKGAWVQVKTQLKSWFELAKEKVAAAMNTEKKPSERQPASDSKPAAQVTTTASGSAPQITPAQSNESMGPFAELARAKQALNEKNVVTVATAGRKPMLQPELKTSAKGVPLYKNFDKLAQMKVKSVPRLDIGEEPRIQMSDFTMQDFAFQPVQIKPFDRLPTPDLMSPEKIKEVASLPIPNASPTKNLEELRKGIGPITTRESIAQVKYKITPPPEVQLKPVVVLSEDDLKMLSTVLLYQKGDRCAVVMGLTEELAQEPKFKNEANFYGGTCAVKLKMFSDGFRRLSSVIDSEDPEFTSEAISSLVQEAPFAYQLSVGEKLMSLKNPSQWLKAKDQDRANYLMARAAYKKDQWNLTRTYAEKVSSKSPDYGSAQYLLGISYYNDDKMPKAISTLESLRAWLAQKASADKNLNSLTAVNLARMKFKQNQFKEAFDLYMKVDKDHPLWVQALVELGWVQFHMDDPAGAIGNMYSLHSPYFAAVYKPESFAVRTIGYLNICQYGDAYKTLTYLEKEYRTANEQSKSYLEKNKGTGNYYESVKSYLRSASSATVDGLPGPILREMARQKDFLNVQIALNESEDELARYNGMHDKIRDDKAQVRGRLDLTQKRHDQLVAQLKRGKKPGEAFDEDKLQSLIRLDTDLIVAYKYLLSILEQGRQGFLKSQVKGQEQIAKFKAGKRQDANRILEARLKTMQKEMAKILENNELLRYEVFAGSGENIRYQVTGGATNAVESKNRIPAHVKPEKILNWNFDGEYWEDEIGSYRSSLQNNCPKTQGRMPTAAKVQDSKS